jgi:predicted glycogen debranching enzyme
VAPDDQVLYEIQVGTSTSDGTCAREDGPLARVAWRRGDPPEALLAREWLLTNGLGGYAFGTVAGVPTRRYHGLLVAALPAPLGRTMVLNHVVERLRLPGGGELPLGAFEPPEGGPALPPDLVELRLVNGRPRWRFERDGTVLEKRLVVPHRQNTTHIVYQLLAGGPATLVLEPALDVRPQDSAVTGRAHVYRFEDQPPGLSIVPPGDGFPPLRLAAHGREPARLTLAPRTLELLYRLERQRGYDHRGTLHVPGRFELLLGLGESATLTASTESWAEALAVPATEAEALDDERRLRLVEQADPCLRAGRGAELVMAADQFIITPRTRPGDEARTVIAGYPWFTDWGRDTMISLEGLALHTGRHVEARDILHTFAHHVRDGLIPNLFPEGKNEGLYHTADATLWFFHALGRYERATGEVETRRFLMPTLIDIVDHHVRGTRFGIGVDPDDGLLRQGAAGYQLTWMDAKVGDWVVTPRRGKAVEINALFYNAIRLLEGWLRDGDDADHRRRADELGARAAALHAAFNRRFWYEAGGHLHDVVDVEGVAGALDSSLRPNQLLAVSLPHPVLERARWQPVLRAVCDRLATPFGLRSLAPGHPDYKPRYDGDLRARDAAYHQGTVWGWLVGPFVDAWEKTLPDDRAGARGRLHGLEAELANACVGTISEIFDAEPPYTPRGCAAQAWSVAEAIRALVLTAGA